jgi:hypothetical protein
MSTETTSLLRRLGVALGASLALSLAANGCQPTDPTPGVSDAPGTSDTRTDDDDEELGENSSSVKVGGCTCPTTGTCSNISYSDIPSNGEFYLTNYGKAGDTHPQSCQGVKPADASWAYVAGRARWACGTKLKIEANGKSCIAQVADCGPNKCVEQAAAYNNCASHKPIIDASPIIAKYLFGVNSAGYSDKFKIKVSTVGASEEIGCGQPQSGGEGGSSGGTSGEGGSAGTAGTAGTAGSSGSSGSAQSCAKNEDCPGYNAEQANSNDPNKPATVACDLTKTPGTCGTRKQIGQSCTAGSGDEKDKECTGGLDGTSRICLNGKCDEGCRRQQDCNQSTQCKKPDGTVVKDDGSETGTCQNAPGCVFDYPSVSIRGIRTPTSVTQSYRARGCGPAPTCMIDTKDMVDAKTGKKLDYNSVKLTPNFSLREMSHQTVRSSQYIYLDPTFIKNLQDTRVAYGKAMTVNSGYRSAVHQDKVCRGQCPGGASSCEGCARCSDHMGGQAVDLKHSSPKCALAKPSCTAGRMHLIYNEPWGGDHLHIDIGSGNRVCAYKAISCP